MDKAGKKVVIAARQNINIKGRDKVEIKEGFFKWI